MAISIEFFRAEIDRAFRVLGADKGFGQNATDIMAWKNEGYISDDEYKALRKYNRIAYSGLPLDA